MDKFRARVERSVRYRIILALGKRGVAMRLAGMEIQHDALRRRVLAFMKELLPRLDGLEKSGEGIHEHTLAAMKSVRALQEIDGKMFKSLEARVRALEGGDAERDVTGQG